MIRWGRFSRVNRHEYAFFVVFSNCFMTNPRLEYLFRDLRKDPQPFPLGVVASVIAALVILLWVCSAIARMNDASIVRPALLGALYVFATIAICIGLVHYLDVTTLRVYITIIGLQLPLFLLPSGFSNDPFRRKS
jgi:hypothetical protein